MKIKFDPTQGLIVIPTMVDGLLGLDFFRGERLIINLKKGIVTLD